VRIKCAQKTRVGLWRWSIVLKSCQEYHWSRSGCGVTNGIKADPRGFTGKCGLGFGHIAHGACGPEVATWHGI
jgi:hypothetical protein